MKWQVTATLKGPARTIVAISPDIIEADNMNEALKILGESVELPDGMVETIAVTVEKVPGE